MKQEKIDTLEIAKLYKRLQDREITPKQLNREVQLASQGKFVLVPRALLLSLVKTKEETEMVEEWV